MTRRILVTILLLLATSPLSAAVGECPDGESHLIEGRYIVVFDLPHRLSTKAGEEVGVAVRQRAEEIAGVYGARLKRTFSEAIRAAVYEMNATQAAAIERDPRVAYVQQDRTVPLAVAELANHWGLDRIDEHWQPLNNHFTYPRRGWGVNLYIVDTGVAHNSGRFGNRLVDSYTTHRDGAGNPVWGDVAGHGTNVANFAAGSQDGVAKGATIRNVKVTTTSCASGGGGDRCVNLEASGECVTESSILEGLDWIKANHVKPAVLNAAWSIDPRNDVLETVVRELISSGITVVAAAGNQGIDACNRVPPNIPSVITVGASTPSDGRASFSNYGACLDLFAPGEALGPAELQGTSYAAPMVAGAAALYLQNHSTASPAMVANHLLSTATTGVLSGLLGSPDRLLFIPPGGKETDAPPVADFDFTCDAQGDCSFESTSTDDYAIGSCAYTFRPPYHAFPISISGCSTSYSFGTDPTGIEVIHTATDDAGQQGSKTKTLSAGPVTKVFQAQADAYVDQVYSAFNYGWSYKLGVRSWDQGQGRFSFAKFDVDGVAGPVISAKLRVRVWSSRIPDLWVYQVCKSSWSESSITWDNWEQQTGGPCGQELDVLYGLNPASWREADVSSVVTEDGWYSFGLSTDGTADDLEMYSKESGLGPELVVTYQP